MSVLDKNLEPAVAYSEVYVQGSVYFSTETCELDRSAETPYIRDVKQHIDTQATTLSISGYLHEITVETMIARGLCGIFNTDAIAVHKATPMWSNPNNALETYVAIIGAGYYQGHPISSCKIVLRRKSPMPPNPSPST